MEISLENLVVDIGAESVNTNKLKIHYLATYHNNALHVISAHIVLCISIYIFTWAHYKLLLYSYNIPLLSFFLAQEAVVEEQNSETDNIKVL